MGKNPTNRSDSLNQTPFKLEHMSKEELQEVQTMSRFRERMEEECFIYHASFANEEVTFMGKDEYGYFRMQRDFENSDQDDKSIHYFASLNKMENYCDSWYGEGWFQFVEEQYEQEERTLEEINFDEYDEYEK